MADAPKTSWIYHPLNGQELLKWVMADMWQKLQQDSQFGQHLAYHNPVYRVRLEIDAHDMAARGQASENSPKAGPTSVAVATSAGSIKTSELDLVEEPDAKIAINVGSEEKLREPDRARELLDEGRYKITNDSGILVDKKVKRGDK